MTITINKSEYLSLKKDATAYRKLATSFFERAIKDPVSETVAEFKKTKLYNQDFLNDLENGLRKSSYGK
jgi:hypothetical protein